MEERIRLESPGKQVEMKWLQAMREMVCEQWDAFKAEKHQEQRKPVLSLYTALRR